MRAVLIAAVLLLAWEGVVRAGLVPALIVAPPSAIVAAALDDGGRFAEALALTAGEILAAAAIAWTTGIATGILAGTRPGLAKVTAPMLTSIFAVPLTIVYPLFIVWFGLGPGSKIAFATVLGYFPVAINALAGIRAVDPRYRRMALAAGASPAQTFLHVTLPLAMPAIATGLRVGTGLVVIGVIGSEVIASLDGIGHMIGRGRGSFETGHVYLGICLALALVVAVNRAVNRLERRLSFRRGMERM